MSHGRKSGNSPAFGFIFIHREGFIIPPARMADIISTAPHGLFCPQIHNIENQRGVYRNGRMQTIGRLPGPVADACHKDAFNTSGLQGQSSAIAGDDVTGIGHPLDFDLHSFQRRIHKPDGSAAACFFTQNIPGFNGLAQFKRDIFIRHGSECGKAELKMGMKMFGCQAVSVFVEVVKDFR